MSEDTSWAAEVPAVNHDVCFGNLSPAEIVPDDSEPFGGAPSRIIGNSTALRRVLGLVRVVAPTDTTVLIQGRQELVRN